MISIYYILNITFIKSYNFSQQNLLDRMYRILFLTTSTNL